MGWGSAGGYAGDPRGRAEAVADRSQGRADVQSQVDSFSEFNPRQDIDDSAMRSRIARQDQMRFRTYSAPLPTPKTPVQKAYAEIRTKTPDIPSTYDGPPQSSTTETSYTPPVSKTESSVASNVALANLAVTTGAYGAQVAKHLLTKKGKSFLPSKTFSKFNPGAPAGWKAWFGSGPTAPARVFSKLGLAGLVGAGSYLGTTGLLKATGGDKFLSQLGSNIAQTTGATTTPSSAWADLLAWANEQISEMEGN